MGNSSYKLHEACPAENQRYQHCQALFFENRLIPAPQPVVVADPTNAAEVAAAAAASRRRVYREGVEIHDTADIALVNEVLDPNHVNFACRDLWEDYKECVNRVMEQKQAAYLERRRQKELQKQQEAPAQQQQALEPTHPSDTAKR